MEDNSKRKKIALGAMAAGLGGLGLYALTRKKIPNKAVKGSSPKMLPPAKQLLSAAPVDNIGNATLVRDAINVPGTSPIGLLPSAGMRAKAKVKKRQGLIYNTLSQKAKTNLQNINPENPSSVIGRDLATRKKAGRRTIVSRAKQLAKETGTEYSSNYLMCDFRLFTKEELAASVAKKYGKKMPPKGYVPEIKLPGQRAKSRIGYQTSTPMSARKYSVSGMNSGFPDNAR